MVVPVAIIAAAVVVPTAAGASPRLPEKSAQEVLAMITDSGDAQYAGTVEQSSNLGFPEMPSMGGSSSGGASGSALELLSGSNTARVFVGPDGSARIQVMDMLAQRDVIRSGNEAWTYDSKSNATTYTAVTPEAQAAIEDAAASAAADRQAELGTALIPDDTATPADLAQKLLDAIDPTTAVAVGDTARVAGRAVYTVTITPKDADTLVASATLSVDSETGLPLAVAVMAVGQAEPAVSIAFSSIEFGAQDAALFTFTAPAGSTVTEQIITADDVTAAIDSANASEKDSSELTKPSELPTMIGTGWSTIVSVPASLAGMASTDVGQASGDAANGDAATSEEAAVAQAEALQLLDHLTTQVADGRVLQTSLFSVFFATDGRIFVGAVGQDALVAAAQR